MLSWPPVWGRGEGGTRRLPPPSINTMKIEKRICQIIIPEIKIGVKCGPIYASI
jgi:hypothetical protein